MRITLHNDEIEAALKTYVSSVGINLNGKDVDLNIIAGRGTNGTSVEMDINPQQAQTKKSVSAVPSSKIKAKSPPLTAAELSALVGTTPTPVEAKVEEEAEEVPANSKSLFA